MLNPHNLRYFFTSLSFHHQWLIFLSYIIFPPPSLTLPSLKPQTPFSHLTTLFLFPLQFSPRFLTQNPFHSLAGASPAPSHNLAPVNYQALSMTMNYQTNWTTTSIIPTMMTKLMSSRSSKKQRMLSWSIQTLYLAF